MQLKCSKCWNRNSMNANKCKSCWWSLKEDFNTFLKNHKEKQKQIELQYRSHLNNKKEQQKTVQSSEERVECHKCGYKTYNIWNVLWFLIWSCPKCWQVFWLSKKKHQMLLAEKYNKEETSNPLKNEWKEINNAANKQKNKAQNKDYRRVWIIALILYFIAFSNSKILPMWDKFREWNIVWILTTETQFLLALLFIIWWFIITKNKFVRWILGLSFIVSIMYSIWVSIENEQQKTNDIMIKTWQYPIE